MDYLTTDTEMPPSMPYPRFPISEQMAALSKSDTTVKRALLELEQAGLLERKRQGCGRHRTKKRTYLRKIKMIFKSLCDKIFMVDKKINS